MEQARIEHAPNGSLLTYITSADALVNNIQATSTDSFPSNMLTNIQSAKDYIIILLNQTYLYISAHLPYCVCVWGGGGGAYNMINIAPTEERLFQSLINDWRCEKWFSDEPTHMPKSRQCLRCSHAQRMDVNEDSD